MSEELHMSYLFLLFLFSFSKYARKEVLQLMLLNNMRAPPSDSGSEGRVRIRATSISALLYYCAAVGLVYAAYLGHAAYGCVVQL